MFQKKINHFNTSLDKLMPILTPSGVVLGLLLGNSVSSVTWTVTWIFAFITFSNTINIKLLDFKEVVKKPITIVVFLLIFHGIIPFIVWVISSLCFPNDPNFVTGFILLFSIPVAVSASVWTGIYNGKIPLTISFILLDTILAPLITPAIVKLYMGKTVAIDGRGMLLSLLWMVVIPSIIGVLTNHFTHGKVQKKITPVCKPLGKIGLFIVIVLNSSKIRNSINTFEIEFIYVGIVCLVLSFLGFLISHLGSKLLKHNREEHTAFMFSGGMRNISAAFVLAITCFEPRVSIPVVIGIVFQQTLAALCGVVFIQKDTVNDNGSQI